MVSNRETKRAWWSAHSRIAKVLGSALITALIVASVACAPVRRSGIDRGGASPSPGPGSNAANNIDQCPDLVAKTEGGSANLFNMPAANGRVMYTVIPGTSLSRFPQNGTGTAEFPQVSFQNSDGTVIGGKEDTQSLYVNRNSISCAPAGSQIKQLGGATTNSQQGVNPPATNNANSNSQTSSPTAPKAGTQIPAAPRPATSTCKVDVPWHQKAMLWIKPECTAKDGKKVALERQTSVTVRQSAEPGSPTRFLETSRNCTILDENIDRATCSPKLPILSK